MTLPQRCWVLTAVILFICSGTYCQETQSQDQTSALIGSWTVYVIDSSIFYQQDSRQRISALVAFFPSGSYRQVVKVKDGPVVDDTGTWSVAADTLIVQYPQGRKPGFTTLASIAGDTLVLQPLEPPLPVVHLTRYPETPPEPGSPAALPDTVPAILMEEIQRYQPEQDAYDIARGLCQIIFPDSVFGPRRMGQWSDPGYFKPIFADLDSDSAREIVALVGIGADNRVQTLLVLKHFQSGWQIIFAQPVEQWYSSFELDTIGNAGPNKTFYTTQLLVHGSNVYLQMYQFFKLIDGQVLQCAEIVKEAYISGWGLYLGQEVAADIERDTMADDMIRIHYTYNFFPGAVYDSDEDWEGHPELSFAKDDETVSYRWDVASGSYLPSFSGDSLELNSKKVDCFGAFGNDSLFVSAFQAEIQRTLKTGPVEQQRLLREYLQLVKENGAAEPPRGGLEKKKEAGGTGFYGPKDK